jgi:hypothetical protein
MVDVKVGGEEALFLVAFVNEVVDGGHLVVLVVVYALLCIVLCESELLEHLQNHGFRGDAVLSDDQPFVLADRRVQLEPLVLANALFAIP